MTRIRKVAVLIDGGFFYKRIKKWKTIDRDDPVHVAKAAQALCKKHIIKLTRSPHNGGEWLDHVYRLFYYDAEPFEKQTHHPLKNQLVKFANTDEAKFRRALFNEIRKKRKFALRLGSLKEEGTWTPHSRHQKGLLKIWHHREYLTDLTKNPDAFDPTKSAEALKALEKWFALDEDGVHYPLRQKGVDMRIGLDIASMTLKNQVDTIGLVTGDSDFIPAAKLARREGVEVILDPMWQSVESDLSEHVDGISSGFAQPEPGVNPINAVPQQDQEAQN